MSVAARSPVQCPAGSRVSFARPAGALVSFPDSHWSSRPSASPTQAETVAEEPSGDSGWAWSKIEAASGVSPSAMASAVSLMVTAASSRAWPTGVNMAMLCRSTARPSARWSVSRSGTSMLSASMPSLGQQRRQLVQQLVRHAGLELDLRPSWRGWFRAAASHVWHAGYLARPARSWTAMVHSPIRAAGVSQPSVLRGRVFSSAATAATSSGPCTRRSLLLGKYWRSSPLVFSLRAAARGWPYRRSTPAYRARR